MDRNRNWWYLNCMARTNMDGKGIRRVLEWLLDRDLKDADLASALGISDSSYSRNKDADTFPSFEELETLGNFFGISPPVLHVAFGLIDPRGILLFSDDEMRQYQEQGGGNHLHPTLMVTRKEGFKTNGVAAKVRTRPTVRDDIRDEIDQQAGAPWLTQPSL